MMPSIPKKVKLGKYVDILTGHPFKSSEYSDDDKDIRLLRGDNVVQGSIRWDEAKRISSSRIDEFQKFSLREGDFVIAMDRTWVKAGLKASAIREADTPSFLVQRVARLRAKNGLKQDYLQHLIRSHAFEQYVKGVQTETAVPHISSTQIQDFFIFLPHEEEQVLICERLSEWDQAIEKTGKLIAAKEKQFEWLRSQLLHPSSSKHQWKWVKFGNIFEQEKILNSDESEIEVLSITKNGVVRQAEYFNKDVAADDKSKYLIVKRGRLVMSGLNFWMGSIDIQNLCDEGIVSPAYKVFKANEQGFDIEYLRFFIRSPLMTRILVRSSVQGASIVRRNLDMDELNNSEIHIPDSIVEQRRISTVLLTSEKEIATLKSLLSLYQEQKRGLMQKLLSGEWRIKTKEAA